MRLVSFMGTGQRIETSYRLQEGSVAIRTPHISHALSEFFKPSEIVLVSTQEAWKQHGATVTKIITDSGHPSPEMVEVPTAGDSPSLWRLFESVVDCLRDCRHPVLLDITHGFRFQPFFASSCVEFVQSVLPEPPQVRVFYGEYRPDGDSPVWELTTFLDVLEWSRSLMMFMRTGRADDCAKAANALARDLNREWAEAGKPGPKPELGRLAGAMAKFGGDFVSVRVGALLLGVCNSQSSAAQLLQAISASRDEAQRHLPPLGLVLDPLQSMVAPLVCKGPLSSAIGQKALISLARLYRSMGRFGEACSILREGWITKGAPPEASNPGTKEFNKEARKRQEDEWFGRTPQADSVSEVRNDIQHAGFRPDPKRRQWFEQQLDTLIAQWESSVLLETNNG